MTNVVVILTTVPSDELGDAIARALVEERLAACVSVLPSMSSTYRWQGVIERTTERQLLIKTTREKAAAVGLRVRALHSYDVPELLVLAVEEGSQQYTDWINSET